MCSPLIPHVLGIWDAVTRVYVPSMVSGFEQFCLSRDAGKKMALIPGSRDFPGNFIFLIKPAEFNT